MQKRTAGYRTQKLSEAAMWNFIRANTSFSQIFDTVVKFIISQQLLKSNAGQVSLEGELVFHMDINWPIANNQFAMTCDSENSESHA